MTSDSDPTILVVDDDPSVCAWVQRSLSRHGFHSISAATASEGLSLLQSAGEQIRLAIVDMILPGTAGLDLAVELGRLRPGLRILYISGFVDSIAMEAIARSSPDAVLLKPFTEQELIDRIRRLMGKPAGRSASGTKLQDRTA